MTRMTDDSLTDRLHAEADLCRAETATDIADLLDEAAARVAELEREVSGLDAQLHHDPQYKLAAEAEAHAGDEARAALKALRERVIGLMGYFATTTHLSRCAVMEPDPGAGYVIRQDVLNLLTDNTPAVNSTEAVNKETPNGN